MSPVLLILIKSLTGGTLVVVFSLIGQVVKPKTFAGIFGAAPSIAVASLLVTLLSDGAVKAAAYATGMIAGAIALVAYCLADAALLKRLGSLGSSAATLIVWAAVGVGLYAAVLR